MFTSSINGLTIDYIDLSHNIVMLPNGERIKRSRVYFLSNKCASRPLLHKSLKIKNDDLYLGSKKVKLTAAEK